jgi:hypothetical protein
MKPAPKMKTLWSLERALFTSRYLKVLGLCLLFIGSTVGAEVYLSKEAALKLVFPNAARIETEDRFLSEELIEDLRPQLAGEVTSKLVRFYVAYDDAGGVLARGILDSHVVRTLTQTCLFVFDQHGDLQQIQVVAFNEPAEYRAPMGWLKVLRRRINEYRWRGVDGIAGATLTSNALVKRARLAAALHQELYAVDRQWVGKR